MHEYIATRRRIFESSVSPRAKLIALALVEHLPNASPSVPRLRKMSGLRRQAVTDAIRELELSGIVTVVRASGKRSSYRFQTRSDFVPTSDFDTRSDFDAQPGPISDVPPGPISDPKADNLSRQEKQRTPSQPFSDAQGQPLRWWTLEGWDCPEDVYVDALAIGLTRAQVDDRIADLRLGPIGGQRGVLDRTAYVRRMLPKWRTWAENDRAKAQRDAAEGPRSRFGGTQATTPAPSPPERLAGLPAWVRVSHRELALEAVVDLKSAAKGYAKGCSVPPHLLKPAEAAHGFTRYLKGLKRSGNDSDRRAREHDRDRQDDGAQTSPDSARRLDSVLGVPKARGAPAEPALPEVPAVGVASNEHRRPAVPTERADGRGQERTVR